MKRTLGPSDIKILAEEFFSNNKNFSHWLRGRPEEVVRIMTMFGYNLYNRGFKEGSKPPPESKMKREDAERTAALIKRVGEITEILRRININDARINDLQDVCNFIESLMGNNKLASIFETYGFGSAADLHQEIMRPKAKRDHMNVAGCIGALKGTAMGCRDYVVEQVLTDRCYCGNPVDYSNPDCVEFGLCEEHADDV